LIGEWPFCPHGYSRDRDARAFDPILVWESTSEPGKISMPGRNDEPCPEGYRPKLLATLREADRFINAINRSERDKMLEIRELNRQYFDERQQERRDNIRAKIRGNSRAEALFREVCAYVDAKRERKYSRLRSFDPRCHFQALSFDASNRQGHSDAATGWKERK
jgi:hypothetical protein